MRLTNGYSFKMPDQEENYNIDIQNENWKNLDSILTLLTIMISVQMIALFYFGIKVFDQFVQKREQ